MERKTKKKIKLTRIRMPCHAKIIHTTNTNSIERIKYRKKNGIKFSKQTTVGAVVSFGFKEYMGLT